MIERINQKRQNEEGFTLVELLVVIVILGILAAIVVFAVGGITDKGETASKNTDTAVLQSAQEAYFAKTSSYTTEATLQSQKYLRTVSSQNDICLKNDGKDYVVVPQDSATSGAAATTACGGNSVGTAASQWTIVNTK